MSQGNITFSFLKNPKQICKIIQLFVENFKKEMNKYTLRFKSPELEELFAKQALSFLLGMHKAISFCVSVYCIILIISLVNPLKLRYLIVMAIFLIVNLIQHLYFYRNPSYKCKYLVHAINLFLATIAIIVYNDNIYLTSNYTTGFNMGCVFMLTHVSLLMDTNFLWNAAVLLMITTLYTFLSFLQVGFTLESLTYFAAALIYLASNYSQLKIRRLQFLLKLKNNQWSKYFIMKKTFFIGDIFKNIIDSPLIIASLKKERMQFVMEEGNTLTNEDLQIKDQCSFRNTLRKLKVDQKISLEDYLYSLYLKSPTKNGYFFLDRIQFEQQSVYSVKIWRYQIQDPIFVLVFKNKNQMMTSIQDKMKGSEGSRINQLREIVNSYKKCLQTLKNRPQILQKVIQLNLIKYLNKQVQLGRYFRPSVPQQFNLYDVLTRCKILIVANYETTLEFYCKKDLQITSLLYELQLLIIDTLVSILEDNSQLKRQAITIMITENSEQILEFVNLQMNFRTQKNYRGISNWNRIVPYICLKPESHKFESVQGRQIIYYFHFSFRFLQTNIRLNTFKTHQKYIGIENLI